MECFRGCLGFWTRPQEPPGLVEDEEQRREPAAMLNAQDASANLKANLGRLIPRDSIHMVEAKRKAELGLQLLSSCVCKEASLDEEKLEAPSQALPAYQDQKTLFLPEENPTCNGESLDETSMNSIPGTRDLITCDRTCDAKQVASLAPGTPRSHVHVGTPRSPRLSLASTRCSEGTLEEFQQDAKSIVNDAWDDYICDMWLKEADADSNLPTERVDQKLDVPPPSTNLASAYDSALPLEGQDAKTIVDETWEEYIIWKGKQESLEEDEFEEKKEFDEDLEEEKLEAPSQALPAYQDQKTLFLPEEPGCWGSLPPELRVDISSYLDKNALCAGRATSREGSSTEAFVASLVQLLQPRLSVFIACHDLFCVRTVASNRDKLLECQEALAENNFQVFAGVQGFSTLFFMVDGVVKRWWDTSRLALTGIFKDLVQHSSEQPIRRLLLTTVRFTIRNQNDKGFKRFLGEQLLAVLCYCTKFELRYACAAFAQLADDCQDPDLAGRCIKALVEVWHQHCQDPPELRVPAIQALAAWTTSFPEHRDRIRDMGVAL